jgi:hypothetical protein
VVGHFPGLTAAKIGGDILAILKQCFFALGMLLIVLLGGCGGIRFSQTAPEAEGFHPQSVALLALDVVGFEEAREALDRILTSELAEGKQFKGYVSYQQMQRLLQESEPLQKATTAYLAKLKSVNFSDSDLSKKIGELARVDALLLVSVDYWYYTQEADKNVAKVGLGMKLINAATGAVIWKAGHDLAEKYVIMKPELGAVARDVARQMLRAMPR